MKMCVVIVLKYSYSLCILTQLVLWLFCVAILLACTEHMSGKTLTVQDDNDDNVRWTCSKHQTIWMKTELQDLGLWPGCRPARKAANAISLWRFPPQPELLVSELPSPNVFQLHPFFIWKPEHEIMARLKRTNPLPCLHGCPRARVVSDGVERPLAIVGTGGQYYILSSQLRCDVCHKCWFADSPRWLKKLPKRFTDILPAFFTAKKAICKTVLDELRCTVEDAREAGEYGQAAFRRDEAPRSFGEYGKPDGWCGVSVTERYLTDCFLDEYTRMETESVPVVKMEPENFPVVKMEPESVPVVKMEPSNTRMVEMEPTSVRVVKRSSVRVVKVKVNLDGVLPVKTGPAAIITPVKTGSGPAVVNSPATPQRPLPLSRDSVFKVIAEVLNKQQSHAAQKKQPWLLGGHMMNLP
ncbi:uncharacterized protein LOC144062562 isoform X2 [Vanacampus margaritifer]